MVKGLNLFKESFSRFPDQYVLIGGIACFLAMEEVGLSFRATKDLDIVLCVETLNREFAQAFWQFIRKGGYSHRQKSTGKKLFYRFHSPNDQNYPEMLELFSKKTETILLNDESHLTPISIDDEVVSLSAILLNKDYYRFIHEGKREIEGLSVVSHEYLIPLKARAWIDLSNRSAAGLIVDKRDIRKHKNDVIRLYQLLSLNSSITLPESIKQDMRKFIDHLKQDVTIDLKNFGLRNTKFEEVVRNLSQIYGLLKK
ncbi:MAG: hypothetical protein KR126chlam4_00863 [Candidatus Anoxychlamydiales bacterium]|uniref:Nucleotidyl transferase AbiEii/AbiGii toxin family protein n=1 Tax=marine sediment metagenome TaxID=412755 RepID=A0A0F9P5Q0_9ZZZZ|nr:hypothetical protein [Candidatus Anoxychlamydiales bacterium]NGX41029.1 hypothetical protein [Candidatus Anoxychlamydiales bacterium]